MPQDLYGLAFDPAIFDPSKAHVIKGLEEVYDKLIAIKDAQISPGTNTGWAELTAKVKQQEQALSDLQAANLKYAQSVTQSNTASATQAKSVAQATQATQQQTKSLQDNIKDQNDYKAAISANSALQKQLAKDAKLGAISADEYRLKSTQLATDQAKLKVRLAEVSKEVRGQVKDVIGANGAYARLNQQYLIAQTNAKNLAAAYGIESKQAIAAAAAANKLSVQLLAIDKTVGQSQRNVGNYGSAISGLKGAFSGLRTLANLLPGIGISGLVLLAVDPLIEAYKWLTKDSEAMKTLKASAKDIQEIQEKGNKDAGERLADLKLLYMATQDVTLSTQQRTKAAKELQDLYPEIFKNYTTEQILLGQAKAGYDELTKSIYKTALARAAEGKLQVLAGEELDAQTKFVDKYVELTNKYTKFRDQLKRQQDNSTEAVPGGFAAGNEKRRMYYEKQKKELLDEFTREYKDLKNREKRIVDAVGLGSLVDAIVKPDPTKKGKASAAIKESTKEAIDAQYELYKLITAARLKALKEVADNEKLYFGERLVASQVYADEQVMFARVQAEREIKVEQDKLKAQENNLKKAKGTERNNLLVEINNTKATIAIAQTKLQEEITGIDQDAAKRRDKIRQDELVKQDAAYNEAAEAAKRRRADQESAIVGDTSLKVGNLDVNYKKQVEAAEGNAKKLDKINKQYAIDKAKIENDSLILSLNSQLIELNSLKSIAQVRGDETTKLDSQINEVTGKILSAQNKVFDNGQKKAKEGNAELLKNIDDINRIATAAATTIQALVDAKYQREIESIQKVIDKNNEAKDQEINNINASTLSAQEKAAELIILDKKVAANNERLAREQAAIKRKQAIADRDAAILQVIAQAAIAVVKLIAQSGYVGIAAGAAIAAEAAASIALILAKPIPSYFKETDNHPGGLARFGEVPEVVSEPGKKPYVQWSDTIGMLAPGTKVKHLTSADVMSAASGGHAMAVGERLEAAQRAEAIRSNDAALKEIKNAVLLSGHTQAKAISKLRLSVNLISTGAFAEKIEREVRR